MGVRFDVLKFLGWQASIAPVLTQDLPIKKLHTRNSIINFAKVRTYGRREEGELRVSKSVGVRFDVLKFRGCQAPTAPVLTQGLLIRKLHNKYHKGSNKLTPRISPWVSDLMF